MIKRLAQLALLLLAATSAVVAQQDFTTTPNLALKLPNVGSTNWGVYVNQDFSTLDAAIGVFKGGFVAVPFNTTPLFDMTLGNTFQITLSNNVTSSTVNQPRIQPGQLLYLIVCQNATGGFSFTFPVSFQSPVPTLTTTASKCSDTTWQWNGSIWISAGGGSGGGGGGGGAAGASGTIQSTNGTGAFTASGILDNGTSVSVSRDFHTKGPNPNVDATFYGARAISPSATPAIPGITGSINSGQATLTLSGLPSTTFVNGDGIDVFGAGAACTLSTPGAPTVTNSLAAGPLEQNLTVGGTAGSTTYNYQIIARAKNGCFTAASSVTSITTGQATLGAANTTISGFTRSGTTVTATTSVAHTLRIGAWVNIQTASTSDNGNFGGWFNVATVPDNTHFTYNTALLDTAGAATSSVGGGTVYYWVGNLVAWTEVTGAYEYYVYGRTGGSLTLIGVSLPDDPSNGGAVTTWEDYGSPMMDGVLAPYYIPTTPPGSASNAPLVTTICSGAGTTTMTLCNNASATVSGVTVLFDNAPTLNAASVASGIAGKLYVPASTASGSVYVVNTYATIASTTLSVGGQITANDTIEMDGTKIVGADGPQVQTSLQFGWASGNTLQGSHASPVLYIPSCTGASISRMQVFGGFNGAAAEVCDQGSGGSQATWEWVNYSTVNAATTDYVSTPLWIRGGFFNDLRHVTFVGGPTNVQGASASPLASFGTSANGTGSLSLEYISANRRGLFYVVPSSGADVTFGGVSRIQGGIMPFFSFYVASGALGGSINFHNVELDTMPHAKAAFITNSGSFAGAVTDSGTNGSNAASGFHNFTGQRVFYTSGIDGQNIASYTTAFGNSSLTNNGSSSSAFASQQFYENFVNVLDAGVIGFTMAVPGAPASATVSAGGSVPVGAHSYQVAAIDSSGNFSALGAATNATTTSGNQTVTVGAPGSATSGAVGYAVFRDGLFVANSGGNCASGFSIVGVAGTFVDNFASGCNNSPPLPKAAASSLSTSGVSTPALILTGGGFKSTRTGNFTANRTVTELDATYTPAAINIAQTFTSNQTLANGVELHFVSNNGTNYAGFKGGASTSNLVWLFPTTDSTGTQCLSSNGSLQLAWSNCSAGTGTPGGANTQVQFNNSGSFGGSTNLTWVSPTLTIGVAATTTGQLALAGGTSGTATIVPQATSGSPTLTLPNTTGTFADGASAPLALSTTTGNLTCATCTTNAAALTNNLIVLGAGGQATQIGPAGTTTTVLHGNASGAPTYAAVTLTTDVTGTLPIANGGTGQTTASAAFNALSPVTSTGDLIIGTGTNTAGRLAIGSNGLCLVSTGTTASWNSCAAGAVSGTATAGQGTFWTASSGIGGSANWTYAAASGHSVTQGANGVDALYMKRFTDTTPIGNFLHFQNAAAAADVFKVDVSGNMTVNSVTLPSGPGAGYIQLGQGTAPALVANNIQIVAPAVVAGTGEQFILPGTAASGFIRWTNSSNTITGAFTAAAGIGACANTVVTATNDNTPPTCSPVIGAMFGSQAANAVLIGPNGSAGIPGFRALLSADVPQINLNLGGNGGVSGTLPIANGGTNATTASQAFNNLSPMTTAGDIIYGGSSGAGTRLAAGTATQVLHSGTTPSWAAVTLTTDVTGTLPIANGGTNATATQISATNGVIYFDGTRMNTTAQGGAGTLCLTSTAGGTPSFGSCSGSASTAWSSLANPSANLSLAMGANTTTFTSNAATGASVNPWTFTDTTNNTGTGDLVLINTASGSALSPFRAAAKGTANGVEMNTSGVLASIGTGSITANTLNQALNTTTPLSGGGTQTSALTISCPTCVTGASSLANNAIVIGSGGGQGTATTAGLTTDGTSQITLGVAGTSVGQVNFKNATSGTLSVAPPTGALGTVTNTLQAVTDTFVYRATSDTMTNKTVDAEGTGNVLSRPVYISFSPSCNNATAGPGSFDVPTSGATTFSCSGTTSTLGNADFVHGSTTGLNTQSIRLPDGFTGNVDVLVSWWSSGATTNAARWSVAMGCVASGAAVNTGPTYNTASATNAAYTGTANQLQITTFSAITTTGCAGGNAAFWQVQRIGGNAGDTMTQAAELIEMQVRIRTTK